MSNLIKLNASDGSNGIGVFKNRVTRDWPDSDKNMQSEPHKTKSAVQADKNSLEVLRLEDRIAQLLRDKDKEIEQAYLKGVADGKNAVIKDNAASLELLDYNVQQALKSYKAKLLEIDHFSLLALTTILRHLFSDTDEIRGVVARALTAQIKNLDNNLVVSVKASAEDFKGLHDLSALLVSCSSDDISVSLSQTMLPGSFEIELTLGQLEFSLAQSLGEVQALIETVISENRGSHD